MRLFGLLHESNTLDGLWNDILKEESSPRSEKVAPVYSRCPVAVCHSRFFETIVGNPRNTPSNWLNTIADSGRGVRSDHLSHQSHEFLTRSARLKKRIAVWDNSPRCSSPNINYRWFFGACHDSPIFDTDNWSFMHSDGRDACIKLFGQLMGIDGRADGNDLCASRPIAPLVQFRYLGATSDNLKGDPLVG